MYEFSWASFFIGFLILAAGVLFVRYYQWVSDNFGGGVGSYERYKFWAFVVCGVGLIVMVNLHVVILRAIFSHIFPNINQ